MNETTTTTAPANPKPPTRTRTAARPQLPGLHAAIAVLAHNITRAEFTAAHRQSHQTDVPRHARYAGPIPKRARIGRHDPCPCHSGRKFKDCCKTAPQP